jgi:quinol monooxygenase YgiN
MILSIIKIMPVPVKRREVLDILHSIKGPTQAAKGCLSCSIFEEDEDDRMVLYLEHWQSREDFVRHLSSNLYNRILEALELSRQKPEVWFFEVSDFEGMELIEMVRRPVS